jgi:hypothetical protein
MLVDKIDFVEFDRQWRELFVDNPTHELVVDGEVREVSLNNAREKKGIYYPCKSYYEEDSGLFLSRLHSHVDNHTVEFREREEAIPPHWQRADSKGTRIFRIVPVKASSTQKYVLNCERNKTDQYEIYTTFYGHVLEFRSLPTSGYSLYSAAVQCETLFMTMLHNLMYVVEEG